jgi:hypothetical protein
MSEVLPVCYFPVFVWGTASMLLHSLCLRLCRDSVWGIPVYIWRTASVPLPSFCLRHCQCATSQFLFEALPECYCPLCVWCLATSHFFKTRSFSAVRVTMLSCHLTHSFTILNVSATNRLLVETRKMYVVAVPLRGWSLRPDHSWFLC